jgi:Fic family protein
MELRLSFKSCIRAAFSVCFCEICPFKKTNIIPTNFLIITLLFLYIIYSKIDGDKKEVMEIKKFHYENFQKQELPMDIVNILARIHEYKGKQELFIESNPQVLDKLMDLAIIQSTEASNKIEGIFTSDKRLKEIVQKKTEPHTRNEQEIAGYRDVLGIIHDNYPYISVNPNQVLSLHKQLYTYLAVAFKGKWKTTDNVIQEEDSQGNKFVRFQPAPAYVTPDLMRQLTETYTQELAQGQIDPLLLIPCFVLDFLCIHPFNDGNGRMSRLLTLLLLYRSDYLVGKYISIEMLIESSKKTYYEALFDSSQGWMENQNDYLPFLRYMLGVILKAYEDFEERFRLVHSKKVIAKNRIGDLISQSLEPLSKATLMTLAPEYSKITVERALASLVKEGRVQRIGVGRSTKYIKN